MKLRAIVIVSLLFISLAGVQAHASPVEGKIDVVSTLQTFSYIVKMIGGSYVHSSYIVPLGTDIHDYSLTPADIDKINSAKLVVLAGSEYFSIDREIKKNAEGKIILDIDDYNATLLPLGTMEKNFHGYWLYPNNTANIARAIYLKLSSLDPMHEMYYKTGYLSFLNDLNKTLSLAREMVIHGGMLGKGVILAVPGVFYIAKALGLDVKGVLVEGPNQFASQSELDSMRSAIRQGKISFIINAESMERSRAGSIAIELSRQTGAKIAYFKVFLTENYTFLLLDSASVISSVNSVTSYSETSCDYFPYVYVISALIALVIYIAYLAVSYRRELLR